MKGKYIQNIELYIFLKSLLKRHPQTEHIRTKKIDQFGKFMLKEKAVQLLKRN